MSPPFGSPPGFIDLLPSHDTAFVSGVTRLGLARVLLLASVGGLRDDHSTV